MKSVLILCAMLGMTACTDKGNCLASHQETYYQPIFSSICNGASCSVALSGMIPVTFEACDQWQYPNGKPEK